MSRSSNSYYSQPLLIPDNSVPTTTVVYAIPGIELPPASHSISGNYPYGPRPENNQCLKYSILLILSVVAIVACGVSVGTPAIWSVTNTYGGGTTGSVQMKLQTGYFIACSEITSRFMNETGCTKYSDVYSYDNEPKYMKASQILGVVSVIFSGITGLIFASLVLCKLLCCNTCGSTCLLLTTVVTQLIALACTISAISVWTVNSTSFLSNLSSTNSVKLDYSAWAGIAGGCIHFIMMISAATLACKQRTY